MNTLEFIAARGTADYTLARAIGVEAMRPDLPFFDYDPAALATWFARKAASTAGDLSKAAFHGSIARASSIQDELSARIELALWAEAQSWGYQSNPTFRSRSHD